MTGEKNNTETGLRSLELYYEPVLNTEYSAVEAYRTVLRVNSPDIGVLLPSQYLPVAQRTLQASKLSMWALSKAMDDIARLSIRGVLLEWISVYVPIRLLMTDDFSEKLTAMAQAKSVSLKRLCIELPGELLFEDSSECVPKIEKIRSTGVRVILCDYGSEFCPLLRLKSFNADFVMLDPTVTAAASGDNEKGVEFAQNVFSTVASSGAEAIATGVGKESVDSISHLCKLSVGKIAGRMKKISGIRS